MNKSYEYKVTWCPICNQGWVEIVKDINTQKLFCCCSECESEWDNPININSENANEFEKYGKICNPTIDEINHLDWGKYIIKK